MQYLKHFAFNMAKSGWHVVISNHRGLGGVSITVSSLIDDILYKSSFLHTSYRSSDD